MGIVIKQSIWSSVIVYCGVAIGYINTLILLPYFLDMQNLGLLRLIQSNGMILIPLAVVGMNGSYTKYFPQFSNNETLRNRIYSFQIILISAVMIILVASVYLLRSVIEQMFDHFPGEYTDYLFVSVIILISQGYFHYLIYILFSEKIALFPSFLNEVLIRILTILVLILFGIKMISFDELIILTGLCYISVIATLMIYTRWRLNLKFDWGFYQLDRIWIKKLLSFGGYTLIIAASSSVLMNISNPITASLLGTKANGILTISIFIGTIIELPKRVVTQVVSPYISKDFEKNDLISINSTYKRTSINLTLIALLLGIVVSTNLLDLYKLTPQGDVLEEGVYLVYMVIISKIISMVFGLSSEVLTYSKHNKINVFYVTSSAVLMIGLNIWLIPIYGIFGAGLAIVITGFYNQFSKYVTLYLNYRFNPFSIEHAHLLLISIGVFAVAWTLPFSFNPLINISLRSTLTLFLFVLAIYWMNISYEVSNLINRSIQWIKAYF